MQEAGEDVGRRRIPFFHGEIRLLEAWINTGKPIRRGTRRPVPAAVAGVHAVVVGRNLLNPLAGLPFYIRSPAYRATSGCRPCYIRPPALLLPVVGLAANDQSDVLSSDDGGSAEVLLKAAGGAA
jgi:hypothetical protein